MNVAEFFKHDFEKGNFTLYDSESNMTYHENSGSCWIKKEYDSQGNETYYESSDDYWSKREYDSEGNMTYYENSNSYWVQSEYDSRGNETYHENSNGFTRGVSRNSIKKMSIQEIQEQLGYKIEITE